jgi:type VI secretion system secreted protein Hcp
MADDMNMFAFLLLEPDKGSAIIGETQDSFHTDEIQVLTYSYGVSNQNVGTSGKGGEKSQSEPQSAVLKTVFSKASPLLFIMAARGDKFKYATISVRKLGIVDKSDADYVQVQFGEVYITDYSVGAGDGLLQTEQFTLKYQTLDIAYRQQMGNGTLQSPICKAYDWNNHKELTPSNLPYYGT